MYIPEGYIKYKGNEHLIKDGEHPCYAWNQKKGYHFVQFGYIVGEGYTVVAVKKVR